MTAQTRKPTQLLLPLDLPPRLGAEDFLVGAANAQAFAYLEQWPAWHSPIVVLMGPESSGKSHLSAIFAQNSQAFVCKAQDVTQANMADFFQKKVLILEDADRFPAEETALFHLLNHALLSAGSPLETRHFILLTARTQPDFWGIRTPDLLSRLRAQPLLRVKEPDDSLLAALFVKLFADRQIHIEASVASYALERVERSYQAVRELVEALDLRSREKKRPITRQSVAEALACVSSLSLAGEENDEAFCGDLETMMQNIPS